MDSTHTTFIPEIGTFEIQKIHIWTGGWGWEMTFHQSTTSWIESRLQTVMRRVEDDEEDMCWIRSVSRASGWWARPRSVSLITSSHPAEVDRRTTLGLIPPCLDKGVCCASGVLLTVSPSICVWWDKARNKEPVVWSRCGVTLTQSSPETLHP